MRTMRPIQTRFRCGSGPEALNLATDSNSPVHSAKGTPSGLPKGLALRLLVGTRFQVLFHSPPGVLFTFPSRYLFTIGRQEYLALEGGPPGFPRDFTCPVVLRSASPARFTLSPTGLSPLYGASFQPLRLTIASSGDASTAPSASCPTTPSLQRLWAITTDRFRLFPVRSPLLGESRLISFPRGTEMFQFPRLPSYAYGFTAAMPRHYSSGGFPHSEIPGSTPACGSPRLIAACHVLHRLLAPRHPPCALCSLTIRLVINHRSCLHAHACDRITALS